MKKLNEYIQQVVEFVVNMGSDVDFVENGIIGIDSGLWQIYFEEDNPHEILLSFHVNCCPQVVANITQCLCCFAVHNDMTVAVMEPYAFQRDENGAVLEMTFGDAAYETVGRKFLDI